MIISAEHIENLPIKRQAYVLHRFLFYLTIAVRDMYTSNTPEMIDKLYAINGLYHHMIPFIDCLMFDKESSFTLEIICQNIQDTGVTYHLEDHFSTAGKFALQQADVSAAGYDIPTDLGFNAQRKTASEQGQSDQDEARKALDFDTGPKPPSSRFEKGDSDSDGLLREQMTELQVAPEVKKASNDVREINNPDNMMTFISSDGATQTRKDLDKFKRGLL